MQLNKVKLLIIAGVIGSSSLFSFGVSASEGGNNEIQSPDLEVVTNWDDATRADEPSESDMLTKVPRGSQAKTYTIPNGKGKLTSNAWRTTGEGVISGNTRQWEYQASAVYSGSKPVSKIRTTWKGQASLRNGASFSLGISGSGITVGGGSSWQTVNTVSKYWENSNGSTSSSYRSNMIVSPSKDYRSGTVSIHNEAKVTLANGLGTFSINAGV